MAPEYFPTFFMWLPTFVKEDRYDQHNLLGSLATQHSIWTALCSWLSKADFIVAKSHLLFYLINAMLGL